MKDKKFAYFQKKIIEHLEGLEAKELRNIKKSLREAETLVKAGLPIGTIRTWKGKKFIKIAQGKWKPKYDGETKGAKMAIAALKKKAQNCTDSKQLMQLVLENRSRFSDERGRPLAFVQELSAYISDLNENIERGKEKSKRKVRITFNKKKLGAKPAEAQNTQNEFSKLVKEATKECDKTALSRAEMLKKPIAKIQRFANSRVEDFNGGIDNFIDYMKKNNPDVTMQQVGKEFARLINHNIARSIFADKEKGYLILDDDGYLKTPEEAGKNAKTKKEAPKVSQSSAKSSGLEKIKAQYEATQSVAGDEDEIYVGDKTFKGTWKLVEASSPSASHDERTFYKTEGFPENADGSTVNDRDYEHDKAAQEAVISVAGNYDGRALSFDSPVVVTQDGVVVSGNNRTMSSKLAAAKGTDGAYIEALKKRAKKFGFAAKDLEGFKNPRVVFEIQNDGTYSTEQFAKFNESETKAMNPIETAVKISKTVKPETIKDAAEVITEFDTMGKLYADSKAVGRIFDKFETAGIINRFTRPQYENAGAITGAGKEFLETVLIGSVVNEKNIRGLNREGCKSIRRKLVRAISPLVNNKSMGGYAVTDELNEAVDVMMQVNIAKDKFKSVSEFAMQQNMFEKQNPVAIELAKKLEGKEKDFADFMQGMNAALAPGASGQVDIFFGGVETKEDVLNRMLGIKKAVAKILTDFLARKTRGA
ncbi:MAG: hypothetical protein ACTTKL_09400 [Treponema sp.]